MRRRSIPFVLAAAATLLCSCEGTYLMYDLSQKDHIYFKEAVQTHTASFALISDDDILIRDTVFVMGDTSALDRHYVLSVVDSCESSLTSGGQSFEVVPGVLGEDFSVGELVIPSGEVYGILELTLHRTSRMLNRYVKVGVKLEENENFAPFEADSTHLSGILSPDFYIYATDGEPACPSWWRYNAQFPLGWSVYIGDFYPDKFRRLLDYFHATEETNPTFYNYVVDVYGVNLEDAPVTFMRQAYSSSWAKYVFIPLYNYYVDWYAAHPDDPHFEKLGDGYVNINGMLGWGNPESGTYGFLN